MAISAVKVDEEGVAPAAAPCRGGPFPIRAQVILPWIMNATTMANSATPSTNAASERLALQLPVGQRRNQFLVVHLVHLLFDPAPHRRAAGSTSACPSGSPAWA
jgi:hypothetical protein